ncbi:hypothetical protein V2A60_004154 [Cordyceps javanica]|uniref:Tat pathway signal sequence n=1 Tax=Cordyceps javanica TaxID=43265 RepID=A0A545UW28_9HYPO|nr:tat pathway signal sequence [Cordyceps javanica]TQW02314.1 tat pathway signal sequence [Cordyceps javanica]
MGYEKLGSDTDGSSTEQLLWESEEHHYRRPTARWRLWTILNTVLFCASLGFFTLGYLQAHPTDLEMMKRTSFYSPVWDSIKLRSHDAVVRGTLWSRNESDPYRDFMTPDPDVEARWEALEDIRVFPISGAQLARLGKDPAVSVKFPPSYGLGDDAYMAQVDVFHQIHCLNLLRHQAWKAYDHEATVRSEPYRPLHWIHVSHCTDILLKNLMCAGSLDIVTYQWLESQHRPWPDFDVNHKCRDFGDIVDWQERHAVPVTWGRNVTRPVGFQEVRMPDLFFELNNVTREFVAAASEKDFQDDHAGRSHDH